MEITAIGTSTQNKNRRAIGNAERHTVVAMRQYDGDLSEATAFITYKEKEDLEDELINFFNSNEITYNFSEKSQKINFSHAKQI